MKRKTLVYVGAYVVGIYVLNRLLNAAGKPGLPVPGILDPLGYLIGYPAIQVSS